MPDFILESTHHPRRVCGVDEAGRGPWAGPVVAAAAFFYSPTLIAGLNDSKQLSEAKRAQLVPRITQQAAIGIGIATVEEIEELNIWGATSLAMRRAVLALPEIPDIALIDGKVHPKNFPCPTQTVIGGDAISHSIAAASIIAKETRDQMMRELAATYPHYGFERHAGYGTKQHRDALARHGVCPAHRRGYKPIQALLEKAA